MRLPRFLTLPFLATVALLAIAYALDAPFLANPDALGVLGIGMAAAAPGAVMAPPWGRIRKDLSSFEAIPAATGRASCEIAREARTLYSIVLQLGGTTFNETYIDEVRLRLGSKTIWVATGAHLRKMNAFKGYYDGNRYLLWIDFTRRDSRNIGGAFLGGIDLSQLPDSLGVLKLEVKITGASSPTLEAKGFWGLPQDNNIIQKLLQMTWSTSGTGRRVIPMAFKGARVRALYMMYDGTDWAASATATAWSINAANTGTCGAVTVSAGAKIGTHKLVMIEPGSNVGTFVHEDPDGIVVGRGVVASAYSGGGLAFTVADGSQDFISGEGFDITVSENVNGNLSRVEIVKNGETVYDMTCTQARNLQKHFGFEPQQKMFVVDFEADGWPDGTLPTDDVRTLEVAAHLTAADNLTIYAEVLDTPENLSN